MSEHDETSNNLEVMRNADAEAAVSPVGEIEAKLDRILFEIRALRADLTGGRTGASGA